MRSELVGGEIGSDYVSLEYLAPLALNKIESMSLEGLRIQSNMSDSKAPSSIFPQSGGRITAHIPIVVRVSGQELEEGCNCRILETLMMMMVMMMN